MTTIVAAAVYHEWHMYSMAVAMGRSGGRHGTNGRSERATTVTSVIMSITAIVTIVATTNSAFHKYLISML